MHTQAKKMDVHNKNIDHTNKHMQQKPTILEIEKEKIVAQEKKQQQTKKSCSILGTFAVINCLFVDIIVNSNPNDNKKK